MALEENSSIEGQSGALRRGHCGDRRGFFVALASHQKRADGYRQRERQQRTIAQQRHGAEPFTGAKASAIDFQTRHVGAHHHVQKTRRGAAW